MATFATGTFIGLKPGDAWKLITKARADDPGKYRWVCIGNGIWYSPREIMHYPDWVRWWHDNHIDFGCKVRRLGTPYGYTGDTIVVVNGLEYG
jgi:hypothetical protein